MPDQFAAECNPATNKWQHTPTHTQHTRRLAHTHRSMENVSTAMCSRTPMTHARPLLFGDPIFPNWKCEACLQALMLKQDLEKRHMVLKTFDEDNSSQELYVQWPSRDGFGYDGEAVPITKCLATLLLRPASSLKFGLMQYSRKHRKHGTACSNFG